MAKIAFDFDGTLVDCRRRQVALLRAVSHCLASEQADTVWSLKREGHSTRAAMIAIGVNAHRADAIAAAWERFIETPFWLAFDAVLPGVRTELSRLRADGASLFLITARTNSHWLRQQLFQLGLQEFFEEVCVVSPRHAAAQKSEHLRRLRTQLFVGDSETDAQAAQIAGVRFIGVGWGQRSPAFLRQCNVADCADTLSEALSFESRRAA